MMNSLEKWTEVHLSKMGVDDVFAPYIVGMIDETIDPQVMQENIVDVLMGWMAEDQKEQAQTFTRELLQYQKCPQDIPLLNSSPAQAIPIPSISNAFQPTSNGSVDTNLWGSYLSYTPPQPPGFGSPPFQASEELSASAKSFVPGFQGSPSPHSPFQPIMTSPVMSTPAEYIPYGVPTSIESNVDPYSEPSPPRNDGEAEKAQSSDFPLGDDEDMDEERFVWSVAHELVEQLTWKFPECHPASLLEIIKFCDMDVNRASSILKGVMEKELNGVTQVCRHYLQGECRRADCMFLHDTHKITCRFWIRGACTQNDQCIFLHGVCPLADDHPEDCDSEAEADEEPPDLSSEDKFPSLGPSAPTASPMKEVEKSFEALCTAGDLSLDFARALSLKPAALDVSSSSQFDNKGVFDTTRRARYPDAFGSSWLSTGDTVAIEYKQLRAQATALAKARNECFMNATSAFRSGNKARAKQLSKKGQEYNRQMKKCHFEAAGAIFKNRNPPEQLYRDQLMDLHGLHIAEAVELLYEMLPHLADEGLQSVRIVTGSGHHSSGSLKRARLRPAVERFLQSEGYQYSEVPDQRGFIGMFLVRLIW